MDDVRTPQTDGGDLKLMIAIAMSISFGITLLMFSVAYARDLSLLARAPERGWAFSCGAPNEGGVVLPLLLTIGSMALIVGIGLGGWSWLRHRRAA